MPNLESLGRFLDLLDDRGQLVRVSTEVNRDLEIAAITSQVAASDGPALFFERVSGSSFPVVTNLFGTVGRLCWGLGVDSLDELTERIVDLVTPKFPANWLEALKLAPQLTEARKWPRQKVESAISQQVVHLGSDVDLRKLPIGRNWSEEVDAAFLSGLVFVSTQSNAETQTDNAAETNEVLRYANRVPVQIIDKNSILIHWSPSDAAWQIVQAARAADETLSVVVVLGADPALTIAASTPLPAYVDPFDFAGFLRSQNTQIARGRSVVCDVPTHAEIVLEGVIHPAADFRQSTLIGLPTGFFSESRELPAVEVTAITHQANPVVPLMIAGHPAAEDLCIAKAVERMFVPLIRLAIPDVVDVNLPTTGGARHVVFVSIKKTYAMQAHKVMNALWGLDFLSSAKTVVVVDEHVNVHDDATVHWLMASNVDAQRDVVFSTGHADRYDHASSIPGVSSRMGIDATSKLTTENYSRDWPNQVQADEETLARVAQIINKHGLRCPSRLKTAAEGQR